MRTKRVRLLFAGGVAAVGIAAVVTTAIATGGGGFRANLTGYQEDPAAISTTGDGRFSAKVSGDKTAINYRLSYSALEGNITQAHIHFGRKSQSGGIAAFLCTNLGNGPAGTQACPAPPATITGTIRAADVVGPTAQGIEPGAFAELLRAMRHGVTYVNVHSTKWPGGEIRAQLREHGGR